MVGNQGDPGGREDSGWGDGGPLREQGKEEE